jgi:hypothetical protein
MTNSLPPLFVAVGDTHAGSVVGLCTPTFELRKDHIVDATPSGLWLYSKWTDFWNNQVLPQVFDKKGKKIRQLFVVHTGDLVEGLHHEESEILSSSIRVHKKIAIDTLKPIREVADWFGIIMGTPSHDGIEHLASREVAEALEPDEYDQRIRVWVGDDLIDIAHHTRGSGEWTSSAAGLVQRILNESATYDRPVPRYVIRGHVHIVDDSGEKNHRCRAITCPAWQLTTSFGFKINPQRLSDIGGIIINGAQEKFRVVRYIAPRKAESRPDNRTRPVVRTSIVSGRVPAEH